MKMYDVFTDESDDIIFEGEINHEWERISDVLEEIGTLYIDGTLQRWDGKSRVDCKLNAETLLDNMTNYDSIEIKETPHGRDIFYLHHHDGTHVFEVRVVEDNKQKNLKLRKRLR